MDDHAPHPLTSPRAEAPERREESSLRPQRLADFVGQESIKDNLRVFIQAAVARGEALDHVLLYGPPGLGKTTLAGILANELAVPFKGTSAPVFQNAAELVGVLTHLEERQVLFLDEVHRLGRVLEEHLYPAMEDFRCELVVDRGPHARHYSLQLPPFTLVGATTRAGMISAPLRNRFGVVARLDFYTPDELARILERSARLLGIEAEPAGLVEIARRSRGTPRIANRLLRRLRDFAQVEGDGRVTRRIADLGLERLGVDAAGLDELDRRVLETLIRHHGGGPVGAATLAMAVAEETDTLEDVCEPFLIQQGFLRRTRRGRVAARRAYEHLGLAAPAPGGDADLFEDPA
ncbi:MAG: Holliday junction branch migration DNA helicase RuvB [Candidatus Krumholzibacteriota bacterium]|nr:Holliday junction branch migration DNA helicase RuvB [Candidatus Krumholzibacteriota bacterium]